jgi:hypothetical protein
MKAVATKSLALVAGLFCTLAAQAATPTAGSKAGSAATTSDVTVFARYNGAWKTELTHLQTPYSKPSNETMTVKNDCWHSEVFYVCDQIIDGAPKALIVFFYNAEDKIFGSFPITAGSENVHRGEVQVDGNTIIFPWQINDNGKTIAMRIVNRFTSADAMEFRQEYSEDGNKWLPMATGVEHKVDGKVSTRSK